MIKMQNRLAHRFQRPQTKESRDLYAVNSGASIVPQSKVSQSVMRQYHSPESILPNAVPNNKMPHSSMGFQNLDVVMP